MNNPYLSSLKPVWDNPKHVFVDEKKLTAIAKKIAKEELTIPDWRIKNVYAEDNETFIKQVFLEHCINFAFTEFEPPYGKFNIEYPTGQIWRGAMAMCACFMRAHNEGIPIFDARYLAELNEAQMRYIFRGEPRMPLLERRRLNLRQAARVLLSRYDGEPLNVFAESDWRCFDEGTGLVEILAKDFTPVFMDISFHQESRTWLEFQKRAQLLAIVYQGRALSSNGQLPALLDAEHLGPPADYAVPVALKFLGILKYAPELERDVLAREIIWPDTLEEQEIRAQTVYAMVRLIEEVNKRRPLAKQVSILEIDYKMWQMGRKCSEPHHLTPTTNY